MGYGRGTFAGVLPRIETSNKRPGKVREHPVEPDHNPPDCNNRINSSALGGTIDMFDKLLRTLPNISFPKGIPLWKRGLGATGQPRDGLNLSVFVNLDRPAHSWISLSRCSRNPYFVSVK